MPFLSCTRLCSEEGGDQRQDAQLGVRRDGVQEGLEGCCALLHPLRRKGARGSAGVTKTWVSRTQKRGKAPYRAAQGAQGVHHDAARARAGASRRKKRANFTWLAKRTFPGSVGSDSAPASAAARGEAPSALCALCALATSSARSAVKSLKRRRTSISPCSLRAASPYLRMDSASRSAHAGIDSHTSGHARPERGSRSQQVGHGAQPAVRV